MALDDLQKEIDEEYEQQRSLMRQAFSAGYAIGEQQHYTIWELEFEKWFDFWTGDSSDSLLLHENTEEKKK